MSMSNKRTSQHEKKGRKGLTCDEIKKGYAEFFRNQRLVLSGEAFRARKRTGPEKAPSRYKARN